MKASEARKLANGYNRRKYRKDMLKLYKSIGVCIKNAANRGDTYFSFTQSSYRYDNGLGVPIRLFRLKNPSFKIDIKQYGNQIEVMIKW